MTLRVPAFPAGVSVAVAAQAYATDGWYVLPVNPLTKHAGSVLGTGWPERCTRNAGMVRFLFADDVGLALHVGRSGAVVFDVDRPDLLPELLKEHLDVHDGPFQSTRPASPGRGHYCYLQPPGVALGNGKGSLRGEWGEVRGTNGVIIVQPTPHEKVANGGLYRWGRTGNVPVLPPALLVALRSSTDEPSQHQPIVSQAGRGGRPRRPSSRVNLETLVVRILAATQRNIAVFEAACRAGEPVRAGLLRQDVAVGALHAAGKAVGLDDDELLGVDRLSGTIHSGLKTGMKASAT